MVEACLEFTADHNEPALYQQSFDVLEIPLGLYRHREFANVPRPPEMTVLARTEVIMSLSPSAQWRES